jgi:predicted transcriptional regulator
MTVRIPEELDAQLEKLAAARHTSKHALLLEGAAQLVDADSRVRRATDTATSVRQRYADLLSRLEDA